MGVASIDQYIQSIIDPLEAGLVKCGFLSHRLKDTQRRCCILSVTPPKDFTMTTLQWASALAKYQVICATPDAMLRFSPHWPNHIDEVSYILDIVDQILKEVP